MAFINHILEPPSYGWQDENNELIKPTSLQIIKEFFSRINLFRSKKNWLGLTSWIWVITLLPFLIVFFFHFFAWWLLPIGFLYSMVGMGSYGTIWFHRYATHKAYKFSHPFWRFITQNLVIRVLPEEIYVISHHVHHTLSNEPGDPYNAQGGWLYCFLADVNHQTIARNLNEKDYTRVATLMIETGIKINNYKEYQMWGSISHPFWTWMQTTLNWAFWYSVFYMIGGHALACCLFGWASIWAIGVRTFNFEGHGKGEDKRQDGVDFGKNDLSVNQYWPGFVAGEWHSNHHLFPNSARNGFTSFQLDLPWYYIRFLYAIGGVESYNDSTQIFLEKYYQPYLDKKKRV